MKMKFFEEKFYDGELIYEAGKVYDVPKEMVTRWLRRGGEIVEDAEKDEDILGGHEEVVEPALKDEDQKKPAPVIKPQQRQGKKR